MKLSNIRRHPFFLGVASGTIFHAGFAFIDPGIIFPLFLSKLTASAVLIGLAASIMQAGWFLPQLPVAIFTANLPKKMPVYFMAAILRSASLAGLGLVVLTSTAMSSGLALLLFFFFLVSYSLGTGTSGIPFMEIVAKTVRQGRRTGFFGWRQLLGGGLGLGAGYVVQVVLGSPDTFPYPKNYAFLFGLAWICFAFGMSMFSLIDEPAGPTRPKINARARWRSVFKPFRDDTTFRKLVFVRWAIHLSGMCLPYYILFAKQVLGAHDSMAGVYISTQVLVGALASYYFGRLGDKKGGPVVLAMGSLLQAAAALVALGLNVFSIGEPHAMIVVFALAGAGLNAVGLSVMSLILDLAPEDGRGEYVGLLNTLVAPSVLAPVLGGFILNLTSYNVLFATSAILALVGISARSLPSAPLVPKGITGQENKI